jgi:hypothetical protein
MITTEQALFIVRERIEEIRSAEKAWKDREADPASNSWERQIYRWRYEGVRAGLGHAWTEVDHILQECLKEGL